MDRLIIIGCGGIGRIVGEEAIRRWGSTVVGTVRTPDKRAELEDLGITPLLLDLDRDEIFPVDPAGASILYLVPPPGGGFTDPRVARFLTLLDQWGPPSTIVYISTTAVYPEAPEGVWITEETPPAPSTSRGKRRLDAEGRILRWGEEHGVRTVILRVSGIYGPGRLPLMQLLSGQPVLRPEEAKPSNRIHADDLASICLAALERGKAGEVYNVSDGHPTTITHYFTEVARLLELPPPRQVMMEEAHRVMSPLMISYVKEGSLISNRKLLDELGVTLRYPSLTEGLPGCRPPDWVPPQKNA